MGCILNYEATNIFGPARTSVGTGSSKACGPGLNLRMMDVRVEITPFE
jgi:hypothetical protein